MPTKTPYEQMVLSAVESLTADYDNPLASRTAIKKYIMTNYKDINETTFKKACNKAITKALEKGVLNQIGGSFRCAENYIKGRKKRGSDDDDDDDDDDDESDDDARAKPSRGRGRPKKRHLEEEEIVGLNSGSDYEADMAAVKRKKKKMTNTTAAGTARGRGRPKKNPDAEGSPSKKVFLKGSKKNTKKGKKAESSRIEDYVNGGYNSDSDSSESEEFFADDYEAKVTKKKLKEIERKSKKEDPSFRKSHLYKDPFKKSVSTNNYVKTGKPRGRPKMNPEDRKERPAYVKKGDPRGRKPKTPKLATDATAITQSLLTGHRYIPTGKPRGRPKKNIVDEVDVPSDDKVEAPNDDKVDAPNDDKVEATNVEESAEVINGEGGESTQDEISME